MTENPSTPSLSRRIVLQATGAAAVAGYLATGSPAAAQDAEARLATYPIPAGIARNDSFQIQVRVPHGEWQPVDAYNVRLKEINPDTGGGRTFNSSMAYFDVSGEVNVKVTYTRAAVETARVRPLSYGIEPEIDESTVEFTLDGPRNVVIEVNGEIFDCLHLLAKPIETDVPDLGDPNVVYFGPGVHDGGDLAVAAGQTVYLAGGAVLRRKVVFQNVDNARLLGRGMIYGVQWGAIPIENSKNILVDGVTISNNPTGNASTIAESEQVTIRNLSYFSHGTWGDGIDVFCSSGVLIEGAFLRSSDDCIALYSHRNQYYGDVRDITVRDSTLWADVAHPFNVGTHGNTEDPEVLENITLYNVDILDHREPQLNYQGCIALNPGDGNLVRNVRIEDVRVEDFRWGQLIHMRVAFNRDYNTSAGRGIEGVFIKNLSYNGDSATTPIMLGYDAEHGIDDVTFQNLSINGKVIADTMQKPRWFKMTDMVPMHVNEHVTNLRFIDAATAPTAEAPQITAAAEVEAAAGAPLLYTVSATGYPESFAAAGLPEGLTLDTATGVVTGAAAAGTYAVTVSAANTVGTTDHTVAIKVL
ncbi:glycosyl hydrolase family 28 protein [Glycomyces sp. YM15]|uniref:glycosyl hydrolase family 28 protein n=1 Tax=Glycomyces sp. YM15 TaxID=2800446 RepID=UPI0019650D02|nr:glycosyl hydrolase family 28 protein [Glycomyces sp. YM15]